MIFYKHYIGDFQRDTGHLSLTERGAYRALLDYHYATEKPLPKEMTALSRIVGAVSKAEREAVATVIAQFWCETPNGWINHRAQQELEKANRQREVNRQVAQAREANKRAKQQTALDQSTNRATIQAPNQTPDTRDLESPPIPPQAGDNSVARQQCKAPAVSFSDFLAACKKARVQPIAETDSIFDFAEQSSIPEDFLHLAWCEFKARYADSQKRSRDWPRVFRKAVRSNWYKLWYADDAGQVQLTSQGRLLQQAHREAV